MVSRGLSLLFAAAFVAGRLVGPAIVASAPVPPGAGTAAVLSRQTPLNVKARF